MTTMRGADTADTTGADTTGADTRGQPVRTLTPAVVQAIVAPLIAEIERLATEKGQAEGERDSLQRQLAARDDQAEALIAELRRRAEAADREAQAQRTALHRAQERPWWLRVLLGPKAP